MAAQGHRQKRELKSPPTRKWVWIKRTEKEDRKEEGRGREEKNGRKEITSGRREGRGRMKRHVLNRAFHYLFLPQQAVQLLQKRGKADGSFLVRPNSRRPGYYALTLMHNQTPYHYEIVCEVSQCGVLVFGTGTVLV